MSNVSEKEEIVELFELPVQNQVAIAQGESIDPVASYKEVKVRFDKAKERLLKACRKLALGIDKPFDFPMYSPKAPETLWNVERYFPGLNKTDELKGKEARKYRLILETANLNVNKLEVLAEEAEGQKKKQVDLVRSQLSKDVDEQTITVESLTLTEKGASDSHANLKVPALTQKVKVPSPMGKNKFDNVTLTFNQKVVKDNLVFAKSKATELGLKKNKTPQEELDLQGWNSVLAQEVECTRLAKVLETATKNKTDAEEQLKLKKEALNTFSQGQKKRLKDYTDLHGVVKKSIDLLVASGTCFDEDHSSFLSMLSDIDLDTRKDETFEYGVHQLKELQETVNKAAVELQKKVVIEAKDTEIELAEVKDPEDLAGDPVRKQRVDVAREVIAKRLREPLVGTEVVAARKEIPGFKLVVQEVDEQLKQRPDQVIQCARVKLVYGEPLSKIIATTTGDGVLSYFDKDNTALEMHAVLNAPGDKVWIVAGPTTNFKTARVQVEIEVEKDTPTIIWRPPLPVLQNQQLKAFTLANATTKTSFGKTVTLLPALTFVPAINTPMTVLGDVTLEASFAGNDNFKAAGPEAVTLKVVLNEGELGKEAMLSGRAWVGPETYKDEQLLKAWNEDNTPTGIKAQSQKVMAAVQGKTGDELFAYMDEFINPTGGTPIGTRTEKPTGQFIWELPNGMQVRYKTYGDPRPPLYDTTPTFCVEGKTCVGPSRYDTDVTFKVTASGEPGAYGPRQTIVPPGIVNQTTYMDSACATTHITTKRKLEQTITWTNPPDITEGQPLGEASLKPQAEDQTALEFSDASGTAITEETILPAGKEQVLRVKGKLTNRFLASASFIEVKINVKKVQKVTWDPPKEIDAGTELGDIVLNATTTSGVKPNYYHGSQLLTETTVLKPETYELKAIAPATDLYLESEPLPATITVKALVQKVTWNPPTEIDAGTELGGIVLNATTTTGVKPNYYHGSQLLTETTVLEADKDADKEYELKAIAPATDLYLESEPVTVTITVKAKEEM